MTLTKILAELRRRGVTLRIQEGRLLVSPAGKLDESLRAAMRERREELEVWAAGNLLEDVLAIFGGAVIAMWGQEIRDGEAVEEHVPATIERGCFPLLGACRNYTADQLMGFSPSQLAATEGNCGDCTIFHARETLKRRKAKRDKIEAREKARERANHFSMQAHEEESEED